MLYALVGNGDANKKEVLSTLESLRSAAEGRGDEFWMMMCESAHPSDTVASILAWLNFESRQAYYETVYNPDEETAPHYTPDHRHEARRPVDRMLTIIPQRVQGEEQFALLVLSDDIDLDEDALYAITKAIDTGIPVYDLGNQMTPLTVEDPDEVFASYDDAESFLSDLEDGPTSLEFTREDLETLTLAELKAHVTATGVVPMDMRSKDSIIDALLGDGEPSESPTPDPVPGEKFYLVKISADGAAEMRLLPPEQAALVV